MLDCVRFLGSFTGAEPSRQCISLHILVARMVRQGEIEPGKEHGPAGLAGIECFGSADVLKIPVVSPDQECHGDTLQPMSPLL